MTFSHPTRGAGALAFVVLAAGVSLGTASHDAGAAGLGFLGKGPMAKFSDEDHGLFRGALDRALTTESFGQAIKWANPKSPAHGTVTPLKAFERDGLPCRTLRVANVYNELRSDGTYAMCRRNGQWTPAPAG